jgi:hypothetical protein
MYRPIEFVDQYDRVILIRKRGAFYEARFRNHFPKSAIAASPESAAYRLSYDTPLGWKPQEREQRGSFLAFQAAL